MAMFEREIRFIYDFNLNRVKKLGSYLTFEQLVSADLHPAILQYISAEIDFLIFEDRQKLLKESVFDYSGKNIAKLFNQIDEEIKRTKKFSIEYINKILLHSTSFTINYLVRPRWTLSQFLFDNEQEKNSTEIKQILNYVYFYSYLKDTLVSYLDKKKLVSITRSDFETLLAKVDKLGVDTYLPTIIDTAIKSISEMLNIGSVQTSQFPLQAIEMFLEEKELHTHLQKIHEVFPGDPRPKVSTSDLRNFLLNIEHVDLSFDPYMEEETIEEESIPEKESTEFEELEEQEIIKTASDLLDDEVVEPDVANEEVIEARDEIVEETFPEPEPIEEPKVTDDFDQKMNDVIAEIEHDDQEFSTDAGTDETEEEIPVEVDIVSESEEEVTDIDSSFTNKLDEAVDEEYVDEFVKEDVVEEDFTEEENQEDEEVIEEEPEEVILESDMEEEALEDLIDTVEEPMERKQKEIKSGETTITINYPQGYEPEGDDASDEEVSEEALEEDQNIISEEEIVEEEESIENADLQEEIEPEVIEEEIEPIVKEELEHPVTDEEEIEETQELTENIDKDVDSFIETIREEHVEELLVDPSLEETELVEDSTITEADFDGEKESSGIHEIVEEMQKETYEEISDDGDSKEIEEETTYAEASSDEIEEEEPELFPREEVEVDAVDTEALEEDYYSPASRIDITELLENKNMTKIIKVIFDYDMEDFANTIEQISECKNKEEADEMLDKLYKTNKVKPTSKEAGAFNEIIAEYFGSEG